MLFGDISEQTSLMEMRDLEFNFSGGESCRQGQKCKNVGKFVDCLAFVSKSGGITAEIFVNILKYFKMISSPPH